MPAETEGALDPDALFEALTKDLGIRGRLPTATYRVQLGAHFTFRQALELLPYLHDLGVSDLYSSPFFKARPNSAHGYDVVDHNSLSPVIGTREDLNALTDGLQSMGMGHMLDVVPNHMGIGVRDNVWWMDVLENGPSSLYAPFFDVDWRPLKLELANKVLLPILGDHYGTVLENGELCLVYESGALFIRYYGTDLPLNPRTYPNVLGELVPLVAEVLAPENESLLELESIITGFSHLPPGTAMQRSKVLERRREKEILKRRLSTLVDSAEPVKTALERVLVDFNGEKGKPRTFDKLDALLEQQSYRVSFWRVAAEQVNYRRFFDINDLAAIRMENQAVFTETHRLLLSLLAEGRVTGLRIDHPDGLWDPIAYFTQLQREYFLALAQRKAPDEFPRVQSQLAALFDRAAQTDPKSPIARPLYVVVEKILSRGELMPTDWPVHGTSGYDFAARVSGLFVDTASEVGSSRVDLQACKLEYSIVSPK